MRISDNNKCALKYAKNKKRLYKMKKYILIFMSAVLLVTLASCGEDNMTERNGENMTDDVKNGIRDAERGAERAGTVFDTDYNYNVDDYNPYGPESK